MNIKCRLAYSGSHYFGFQKTKEGPTIEETLETILSKILQQPVLLQAASRTDRGVHAEGQVINFFSTKPLDLEKLHISLCRLLPPDISPIAIEKVPENFHPTLDARGKEYHYWICNRSYQLPFHREFSWHYPIPLDLDLMYEAAAQLEGTHDFSTFSPEAYDNPIRTIEKITITAHPENRIHIAIRGDNFLYKMVRNLVGTLVYIGSKKIPLEKLPEILKSCDHKQSGVCAPAHGLCLREVFY